MNKFGCRGDVGECYKRVRARTEALARAPVRAPEMLRVIGSSSESRRAMVIESRSSGTEINNKPYLAE